MIADMIFIFQVFICSRIKKARAEDKKCHDDY